MKHKMHFASLLATFAVLLVPVAAAKTFYVNGVTGSNSNTCLSPTTACKTIKRAITLAASGDSIAVAASTYTENLTININLTINGAGAGTTIVDGNAAGRVITVSVAQAAVVLNKLTIRNGLAGFGGGISNAGTMTITNCVISGNVAQSQTANGGGIFNTGTAAINFTTIANNQAKGSTGSSGGGIYNRGKLTLNNSTVSQNKGFVISGGGGIFNQASAAINNSTITANTAGVGGGINNRGTIAISSATISGNSGNTGGNFSNTGSAATLQDTIVANSVSGGNCHGTATSKGYNLSSDNTCSFNAAGDMNSVDPMLGSLGSHGGPTQTIPLLGGSPGIDAGNPNGCSNNNGVVLKTDQRGSPRPGVGDTGDCDIGAYEVQDAAPSCTPIGDVCGPGRPKCCAAPFPHHSVCSSQTGFGTCIIT